ncbi:hypothetical protein MHY1_p00258 (plasmid) [Methylovirgula sp. HY1]|nr:hypothetical protein MHY1_p00258 [Methylovirgula sp. HY1]
MPSFSATASCDLCLKIIFLPVAGYPAINDSQAFPIRFAKNPANITLVEIAMPRSKAFALEEAAALPRANRRSRAAYPPSEITDAVLLVNLAN